MRYSPHRCGGASRRCQAAPGARALRAEPQRNRTATRSVVRAALPSPVLLARIQRRRTPTEARMGQRGIERYDRKSVVATPFLGRPEGHAGTDVRGFPS